MNMERDARNRINDIQDEYVHQSEAEYARQEGAMDNQRHKGYEALRDLQLQQQAELRRMRAEGEHELKKLQDQYQNKLHKQISDHNEEILELEQKNAHEYEIQKHMSDGEVEANMQAHSQRLEHLRNEQNENLATITEAQKRELACQKENNLKTTQEANRIFQERYQELTTGHDDVLQELNGQATDKLKQLRMDNTQKLAAYALRQEDPFYRAVSIDAELSETDDEFILTARIPEHEQKNISVNVPGDRIILSCYRRNEEKIDLSPGHTQSTAAYQSFSESFPINFPVDANRLTREFQGDQLIVRLPKKINGYTPYRNQHLAKQPERLRAQRPEFPENLPLNTVTPEKKPGVTA